MAIRQLVIAIDAMEWSLVRAWAAEGKLPTLKRLIEEGTSAKLSTSSAQLPDTVWTCIFGGVNPGKVDRYFYVQYDAATMGLRHVTGNEIATVPVWRLLSDAGVRVGVADLPKFPVEKSLNGFQVANWGSHATDVVKSSWPPDLMAEIQSRCGSHPVGDCDKVDASPSALMKLRGRILDGLRLHGELFRWLMAKDWDVFFASFSAPHCIGHHFWRFADENDPRYDPAGAPELKSAIEDVYRETDRQIGELIKAAGEDVRCIVFAAHGMGPVYHASWNLSEILELLGYGNKPAGVAQDRPQRTGRVNPWRLLKMMVPGRVQYAIKSMLPKAMQDRLLFLWYAGNSDWKGCRAFSVPNNDSVGAIRISVKGRDKNGLVEPGDEYRRVCRDIAAALKELTDPKTGLPVVTQVTISQEEFSGPFLDSLPDITVLWDQTFAWDSLHSPRFGTLQVRRQDSRSGSHTPYGFAIFHGPGVGAGKSLEGYSIYDIAPTILQSAEVAIPDYFDGRPMPFDSEDHALQSELPEASHV